MYVQNSSSHSCCGAPADEPCRCGHVDNERPVPLACSTPAWDFGSGPTERAVVAGSRVDNGSYSDKPTPLGQPTWNFGDDDADAPQERAVTANAKGDQGDKPTPLGVPVWVF
jgi:hypothetical protein